MQVREIMTPDAHIVDPDMSIKDVASRMLDEDLGAYPVGENDRLVGMVTDRDITVRGVARGDTSGMKVRDVMSERVCYVFEDDEAEDAAKQFAEHLIRRLPVLNRDKRLVGIVALADLAKAGIKDAEFLAYQKVSQSSPEARRM